MSLFTTFLFAALCLIVLCVDHNNALLSENREWIARLNAEQSSSAFFEANVFANISRSEFASTRLMMNLDSRRMLDDIIAHNHEYTSLPSLSSVLSSSAPASYDWRGFGAVTAVKNQYSCGTCWSFSTTGNIEGQWFLAGHALVSLSEEFLTDCDSNDCGMFGGWPYLAMDYVIARNGLPSEHAYPYCCGAKPTCYPCMATNYNKSMCGNHDDLYCNHTRNADLCPAQDWTAAARIVDWMSVPQNETVIASTLVQLGPLSVAMNAQDLSFYRSGVYNPKHCNPEALDHAVLIVGYGVDPDSGLDYWTVKNSWGESWGENGYFRITRGVGMCGINTAVISGCVGKCQ